MRCDAKTGAVVCSPAERYVTNESSLSISEDPHGQRELTWADGLLKQATQPSGKMNEIGRNRFILNQPHGGGSRCRVGSTFDLPTAPCMASC